MILLNSQNEQNKYQYLTTSYSHRNSLLKWKRTVPNVQQPSPAPLTDPTAQFWVLLCAADISLGLKNTGAHLKKKIFFIALGNNEVKRNLAFLSVKEEV